jgi:predicted DNA-binding protein (UPF0251 family)
MLIAIRASGTLSEARRERGSKPCAEQGGRITEMRSLPIGRIMDQQDVTQTKLAARMGVSRQQVSRLLRTPNNTMLKTLVRIACALGLELNVTFEDA